MSGELIGILSVGVSLAALTVTLWLRLDATVRDIDRRLARVEGILSRAE